MQLGLASLVVLLVSVAHAAPVFSLKAREAEEKAIAHSDRLKAFVSDEEAAGELASAGLAALFPRLSFEGSYQHVSVVPTLAVLPNAPAIQLGANSAYSIGPIVRYTLWDTLASLNSYRGATASAGARAEDRKSAQLQLLLSIRSTYIQVQSALEELSLVDDQLALSRAEDADIGRRFKAGAASRLDRLTSSRAVLNYELLFQQRQSTLATALRDLLALTGDAPTGDLSRPGPPGLDPVSTTIVLELDSLASRIADEKAQAGQGIAPPDDRHPQLQSLELQARSAELQASSQTGRLLPTIQVFAKTSFDYPNGPILQQIHQNTLGASFSLPLFFGDPTWRQAAEKRREADAARYREDQARIDLGRDYVKSREVLASLWSQRELAARDVAESEEEAKLYFVSYKAGKSNILDVQTSNDHALQSKVNASRLDAQILNQLATLKALSAKELLHD